MTEKPFEIITERLILRDFIPSDAADLQAILGDAETMKFCEPAYDFAKTQHFLQEFCIQKKGALAAQLKGGPVIAYLLFHEIEPQIFELGWWVNRRYQRQGYAKEACQALIQQAFAGHPRFSKQPVHKIVAETIDPAGSGRLALSLGFQLEGQQKAQTRDLSGNWCDLYWYGLLNEKEN